MSDPPGATICDESEAGFGWIAAEPDWMQRTSHALATESGVWLVDPVDFAGLDARVRALGEPRGVLRLLSRHTRDCGAIARRLGVPELVTPRGVPGSPFAAIAIPAFPGWNETALWWEERHTLVVAEAVGTVPYYCAPGRPLGVNPALALVRPPKLLLRYPAEHLLTGHGAGLHEDVPTRLAEAVRRSRRDLPGVARRIFGARRPR